MIVQSLNVAYFSFERLYFSFDKNTDSPLRHGLVSGDLLLMREADKKQQFTATTANLWMITSTLITYLPGAMREQNVILHM
jgi:hypothetical protein